MTAESPEQTKKPKFPSEVRVFLSMSPTDLCTVLHLCAAAPEQEQPSPQSPGPARASAPRFRLRKQQHNFSLVFLLHKTRNYTLVQSPGP